MSNALINRNNDQIPDILLKYSNMLDMLIDMSSDLLLSHLESNLSGDEKLVPCLFFRNIIEYADSISILIKNSSIEPIKALNRILLENVFQLEYLLIKDTDKRSFNFLVWSIKNDIKNYKKLKPDTLENETFKGKFTNDKLIRYYSTVGKINVDKALSNSANILKQPGYKEASIDYEKYFKKHKIFNWYSIDSGLRNIKELADSLKMEIHYDVFYRTLSSNIHGMDVIKGKLLKGEDNNLVHISKIREPINAQNVLQDSLNFLMTATLVFLHQLLPYKKKEFTEWYIKNFQKFYGNLQHVRDYKVSKF